MRYIPINRLQPGQRLAEDLSVSKYKVLIRGGAVLTASIIQRIKDLGFQGAYIEDKLSDGLEITDIISHDLKMKTRREVEKLFTSVEKKFVSNAVVKMSSLKLLLKDVVDEIFHNRRVMLNMIDLKTYDDYTYSHCLSVAMLSTILGITLGMNRNEVNELATGALLHDMGKMFITKEILNKPGKLDYNEFERIKTHSKLGFEYLREHFDIPHNSKLIALQHHELYNGNGYPEQLSGDKIHLYGRIVCVADVYDALISDRPYRKALLPSDAIEYIMGGYNTMFDPDVVKALTKKVAPYPVGTCLKLSSGETCIVVENRESAGLRPVVKIIENNIPTNHIINLADRDALNLAIKEIINL